MSGKKRLGERPWGRYLGVSVMSTLEYQQASTNTLSLSLQQEHFIRRRREYIITHIRPRWGTRYHRLSFPRGGGGGQKNAYIPQEKLLLVNKTNPHIISEPQTFLPLKKLQGRIESPFPIQPPLRNPPPKT